jgi:hypothetical protein
VRVVARGQDRFVNATSRDVAVPTGGRVLVVALGPDNTVVVQAMPRAEDTPDAGALPPALPAPAPKGVS